MKTRKHGCRDGQSRLRTVLLVGDAAILAAGVTMVRRRSRSAPARPGRFEESGASDLQAEEVFTFVADPLNDGRWTPQIEEVRKTPEGLLSVGSTFEALVSLLGRRSELSGEITEYDEANRKLGLRTSSGPLRIEAVRTVEAFLGGARFTSLAETRTGGFFWLLPDPLLGALLWQQGKQTLYNLKAFLETRSYDATQDLADSGATLSTR